MHLPLPACVQVHRRARRLERNSCCLLLTQSRKCGRILRLRAACFASTRLFLFLGMPRSFSLSASCCLPALPSQDAASTGESAGLLPEKRKHRVVWLASAKCKFETSDLARSSRPERSVAVGRRSAELAQSHAHSVQLALALDCPEHPARALGSRSILSRLSAQPG